MTPGDSGNPFELFTGTVLDAAGSAHLPEVAMLAVVALAKAWQTYSDRQPAKRIGRRSTDVDCEVLTKSQRQVERGLEELTAAIKELIAVVRAQQEPVAAVVNGTAGPV